MRKQIAAGLAFGLALGGGIALAATVSFVGSPYIPLPTGVENYTKQSPTSGALSFGRYQSMMQIGGASTITSLTINLAQPLYAYDGAVNCFYTKPAITTLTLQATSPQTLNDAVTAASAATRYCYQFSSANNTWDRTQ